MYKVSKTIISETKYGELHQYLEQCGRLANNLRNATIFRMRQHITANGKTVLSENEQQVQDEINKTISERKTRKPGFLMTYNFMEKLMRVTENPDFFSELSRQTADHVLKSVVHDFKAWIEELKKYKVNPAAFTGKPAMPKYKKKNGVCSFTMTNQDCVIGTSGVNTYLKFPKTKATMPIGYIPEQGRLMEVQVMPSYGDFVVICIFKVPDNTITNDPLPYSCGIDFGVDNIISLVSNHGQCVLYKGGAIKAENQWYNKQMAHYRSIAMQGHTPKEAAKLGLLDTRKMRQLNKNHNNFMHDIMHKISSDVVRYCLSNQIGLIVMGVNKGWKQSSNMGHVNNQNFVQMPIATLRNMIQYKAERVGILVVEQEESYTSKADLMLLNEIPVYGVDDISEYKFTGKRIKRGLYRSGNGTIINADLNGAGNILRKYSQNAFTNMHDWLFLQNIKVRRFPDLYKSIPVKGIAAS